MGEQTLFRKSSIDRLRSPEQLNEYIRVTRPSVWLVLAAVVLLLVGVIVWGVFGTVETVVQAAVYAENGQVTCYVREEDAGRIEAGMPISMGELSGSVKGIAPEAVRAGGVLPADSLLTAGLELGDACREIELEIAQPDDGVYLAEITVERIHPVTFVIQ